MPVRPVTNLDVTSCGTLLDMTTLAAGLGPDAVDGMLWVAGILVVIGVLALLLSRRGRRPSDKIDEQDS